MKSNVDKIRKYIEEIKIRYATNGYQVDVQINISPTFVYFVCRNQKELVTLIDELTSKED
jgi:hypothetical protein